MIKNVFIPYEEALALKDMGFDELRNLVIFFKSYDYVVKFKPHPQYVEECVYKWADILNIEVIDLKF